MNKPYPNCASPNIYRRHPHSLKVCCDCNHRWQAKLVLAPILRRDKFWLSTPLKGWHYVEVWHSITNSQKFAYRVAYSASLLGDLKGEFDTAGLALEAGIMDAKGLLTPANSPI